MLEVLHTRRSLERLVNQAAAQITRLSVHEAASAWAGDGIIIDIRSPDARELVGVIPGSLHIPRTVLEWRVAWTATGAITTSAGSISS